MPDGSWGCCPMKDVYHLFEYLCSGMLLHVHGHVYICRSFSLCVFRPCAVKISNTAVLRELMWPRAFKVCVGNIRTLPALEEVLCPSQETISEESRYDSFSVSLELNCIMLYIAYCLPYGDFQKICVGKVCNVFNEVSYAHQGFIYLIKNTVKNSKFVKYYYNLKELFVFEYNFKCNLFLWFKLNFQYQYSSLQCHMIPQKSF